MPSFTAPEDANLRLTAPGGPRGTINEESPEAVGTPPAASTFWTWHKLHRVKCECPLSSGSDAILRGSE